MADYLDANKQVFNYLGNINRISNEIRKPHFAARHEFIKIASECFQRTIMLYKNSMTKWNCEVFENDNGPLDPHPIRILFIGPFVMGHFQAILPKTYFSYQPKNSKLDTNNDDDLNMDVENEN